MAHSLNRTNFRINKNLIIDGTFNPDYILISDSTGVVSWRNPSEYITNEEPLDRFIGELYGGGIVVAVWREQKETIYEKTLIASVRDYRQFFFDPDGAYVGNLWYWSPTTNIAIGPTAQYHTFGASNSFSIASQNSTDGAAVKCLSYINEDLDGLGVYGDWYLPSTFEINHLANNATIVNKVIYQYSVDKNLLLYDSDGSNNSYFGPSNMSLLITTEFPFQGSRFYWTSTEADANSAYFLSMGSGGIRFATASKGNYMAVRPFRQDVKRWNGTEWIQLEQNNRRRTGKILITYDQALSTFFGTKMIDNITSTETSLGNTVFTIAGYSNLPSDLSQYDHIWDIGLEANPDQSLLVPTGAAAKYTTYLQQGGGLFMLGENSGFGVRNSDLASFISGIGGGTVQNSTFEDRNVTVDSEFLLANNQSSLVLPDSGRFGSIGTGTPITRNSSGQTGQAVVWKTGSLSLAPKGAIVVVLDINFISNYYAPGSVFNGSLTYAKEFVDNISQILNKK